MNHKSIDEQHIPAFGEDPDPPDNAAEWEGLPEDFREKVADRFEAGIANEWDLHVQRAERALDVRDARHEAQQSQYRRAS